MCRFHRNKLNVFSRAPRSQATSERQVIFLIANPAPKKYSFRFVCTTIHLFNTRKILESAHVSQVLDLIGLWEPTSPLVRKATLGSTVCSLPPGAKFAPVGKFSLWKQNSTLGQSAPGAMFAPGGKVRPWVQKSSLGTKFTPWGKIRPGGQNSPRVGKIRP